MKITRRFTKPGQDVFSAVQYEKRTSRISNPDGSVVFEMNDAEIPSQWSQLATAHKIDLVVCSTAGLRRGVREANLAPGFRISGLGQMVEASLIADRAIAQLRPVPTADEPEVGHG